MTSEKSNGCASARRQQLRELIGMLRFSKKAVIFSYICVVLFTAVMTAMIILGGRDPDILITEFFSYFKIEGGILGILKFTETVIELIDRRFCGPSGDRFQKNDKSDFDCIASADNEKTDEKL